MVDWDAMHGAMNNAKRDIVNFLETEVEIAKSEGDQFLTNLYGQAIIEIRELRRTVEILKAGVKTYQAEHANDEF